MKIISSPEGSDCQKILAHDGEFENKSASTRFKKVPRFDIPERFDADSRRIEL